MDNKSFRRNREDLASAKKAKRVIIPKPVKRLWRKYNLTRVLLLLVTIFLIVVTGYLYYLSKVANVGVLQRSINSRTEIIDRDNKVAGQIAGAKGTVISFDSIPQDVKNAVVATEDRTFYKNRGVNYSRTILAALTLGHFGGGSTITQQLAKNSYLSQAQTIDRKAREIFLALQITKKYSKDQILSMYLNSNYYGNNVYGIEDASEKYFGVPASQLTLDEAATLAGLLKGPEIYNPYYSIKYSTDRRNTVLQNMVNAGYISQATADNAMKVSMKSRLYDNYQTQTVNYKYPSYYNAVVREAENKYGLSISEIQNNGYKIFTGLDQNKQEGMQKAYSEPSLFPTAPDGVMAQSASVALNPKSGEVEALVGNAPVDGYKPFTDFNYATQSSRSPGSVIKPLIVYAPAVEEKGWSINHKILDEAIDLNGWKPQNADQQFHGELPMYQALANSYNIPAIKTYEAVGYANGNAMGKKFGINLSAKNNKPSTALGAGIGTNPWEIAQAYSTFANGGVMQEAHLITKIEDASGRVIKKAKVNSSRVISEETAKKMTQMMLGTFSNGTGAWAGPVNYSLAGKTGTNEDDDQWVVVYTPDIVVAEWLGYADESKPGHNLTGTSELEASVIFRQEASYIFPYTAGSKFSEENPYTKAGIAAVSPLWTQQRQLQDNIVYSEQAQTGNLGNSLTPNSSQAEVEKKVKQSQKSGSIVDKAKEIWDNFTGLFR